MEKSFPPKNTCILTNKNDLFRSAYSMCDSQYRDSPAIFLEQADVIRRMTREYPGDLHFATSVKGLEITFVFLKNMCNIGISAFSNIFRHRGRLVPGQDSEPHRGGGRTRHRQQVEKT